jgi:protoporphyrinogen oxidase
VTHLVQAIRPHAPGEVLQACQAIKYRSIILIYLVLAQGRFTEYDAHYFPDTAVPITRLSEPKNYAARTEPAERTVLCAELPCERGDRHWNMSDSELGEMVRRSLEQVGIPIQAPILDVATRRLPQAYPIYEQGYEAPFEIIDGWLDSVPGVLTLGRQGLFAHDNTHHTLAMAHAAVGCLDGAGRFDKPRWHEHRKVFATHVVED